MRRERAPYDVGGTRSSQKEWLPHLQQDQGLSGGIDIHLVGLQNSMGRQQGIGHIKQLRRDGGHECKERGAQGFPKKDGGQPVLHQETGDPWLHLWSSLWAGLHNEAVCGDREQ